MRSHFFRLGSERRLVTHTEMDTVSSWHLQSFKARQCCNRRLPNEWTDFKVLSYQNAERYPKRLTVDSIKSPRSLLSILLSGRTKRTPQGDRRQLRGGGSAKDDDDGQASVHVKGSRTGPRLTEAGSESGTAGTKHSSQTRDPRRFSIHHP